MIEIDYKSKFIRKMNKLPHALQDEAEEKISLFAKNPQLPSLRAHKLSGHMKGLWSFSVNYAYRIIYYYEQKDTAVLLDIGDHSIYE